MDGRDDVAGGGGAPLLFSNAAKRAPKSEMLRISWSSCIVDCVIDVGADVAFTSAEMGSGPCEDPGGPAAGCDGACAAGVACAGVAAVGPRRSITTCCNIAAALAAVHVFASAYKILSRISGRE